MNEDEKDKLARILLDNIMNNLITIEGLIVSDRRALAALSNIYMSISNFVEIMKEITNENER
jgi:hypothetical protein